MNINLINHQPIFKVRTFEQGSRFAVGHSGNKKNKYVEAAKGTNLFFAIYQNKKGERSFKTIPLNEVIESQKIGLSNAPYTDENGNQLLFTLSPNDLVYVPKENEDISEIYFKKLNKDQISRIYKFTDGSGTTCNFIQHQIANIILNLTKKEQDKLKINLVIQNEIGAGSPQSKNQNVMYGNILIKNVCLKLKIDRLGNICNEEL